VRRDPDQKTRWVVLIDGQQDLLRQVVAADTEDTSDIIENAIFRPNSRHFQQLARSLKSACIEMVEASRSKRSYGQRPSDAGQTPRSTSRGKTEWRTACPPSGHTGV
jgi:hypothetical protein